MQLLESTPRVRPHHRYWEQLGVGTLALLIGQFMFVGSVAAMGLKIEPAEVQCGAQTPPNAPTVAMPAAAKDRVPDSQAVAGSRDIAWAWIGSPTRRYPHTALGSAVHGGSAHVLAATPAGGWQEVVMELPLNRVFEDRVPRLVDLDQDGRDELLLIEADALRGAALVVLGVRGTGTAASPLKLVELARGPHAGSTFRWLNPVGVADFDGDGRLDVASITTPHIGGVLNLYHYRPPRLEPFATTVDVSNHKMGELEQRMAVVVNVSGERPTIVVPDMTQRALHALRWEAPGRWKELADLMPMPARVVQLTPIAGGACAGLSNGSWARVTLNP